jgi:heme-degrading monooxygenase HmoA
MKKDPAREIENRVERVPASPDEMIVLQTYNVQAGSETAFETQWRIFSVQESAQEGCQMLRLHRDLDNPTRYVSYSVWESRLALIGAIRALGTMQPEYPLSGEVQQSFIRLKEHAPGQLRRNIDVVPGQIVSLRHFYLKVKSEGEFQRLWTQSAQHEARQPKCLYKRLHRNLNLPTHYISYSLWTDRSAPDEAAHQHGEYQKHNKAYPLSKPVIRLTLEIVTQFSTR